MISNMRIYLAGLTVVHIFSESKFAELFITADLCTNLLYIYIFMPILLMLSGDIESNPGPDSPNTSCFSILHQNIRSIRSKMDFIKSNFIDFDVLCFTETHLSNEVNDDFLVIDDHEFMFRKDNSSHLGGFLMYVSAYFRPVRMNVLEQYLPESLWVELNYKNESFLIGTIYRNPHLTVDFWDRVNICLEKANDLTSNIIVLGDINPLNRKFLDIMTTNNLRNIIDSPTRVTSTTRTLLDPIAVSQHINILNSGILERHNI